jgi:PAS domain S-box
MVEEITIRKQAEEKIKQQNKFLNTVIESLAQPFFVIEVADYRVTVANTAAHYGYFPEDATCHALTHNRSTPCEGEFHPCPRDAVIKSGKPVVFEHRHTDETGAVRYFEVHGYPIFGEAGAVTQMIEYTVDITDRKRVEAEILRAKEQAELLYKIIPSGIFTVDCDDVVTTWNDKSAEITGYPVQEVLGKKCPIFNDLPGEERVGRFDPELPIAQTAIECVIRRKDGTKRVVLKNTEYLYDSQGKVAGGIESFEDITERKQAEEKIKNRGRRMEPDL